MIYMICPECGEVLRHKQIIYEDEMIKVCNELNLDYNKISQEGFDKNEEYVKKRQNIVNKLAKNMCCKFNLITYINLTDLIKG